MVVSPKFLEKGGFECSLYFLRGVVAAPTGLGAGKTQ